MSDKHPMEDAAMKIVADIRYTVAPAMDDFLGGEILRRLLEFADEAEVVANEEEETEEESIANALAEQIESMRLELDAARAKRLEDKMPTIGQQYSREQARVRRIQRHAVEIGPAGKFLVLMTEQALLAADLAVANGDVVAMLQAYNELGEFKE